MCDSTYGAFDALTKDNYKTWRIHAEALLVVSDLWDYVGKDKELIPTDVGRRKSWMKQDKIAKSKLLLHISSTLLPLVRNCTTSREVWLKLANVYGNRGIKHEGSIANSDTDDEDGIIDDIEIIVDDFFATIIELSEKKIIADKKSLSTNFTDNLFSQLKINSTKKLPNKTIIVNTVSDFIDVISELSKHKINERKNELSGELIDSLLVKFNINPHQNDNDETKSEADTPQTRDNDTARNQSDMIYKDEMTIADEPFLNDFFAKLSKLQPQSDHGRILWGSYGQEEHGNSMSSWASINTPPSTPTPGITRKCGVCRKEGHNRTTCPLNKSVASASKYTATTPGIPKISSSRSTATNSETSKKSYKCGVCHKEGHNRTTCPSNKPNDSASKYTAATPGISKISSSRSTATNPETPKRSYKCGVCHKEGHNRTFCPSNKPAPPVQSKYTTIAPETPKRSYKCGGCGNEGHNIRSCPWMNSAISSPKPATIRASPAKSYTCGSCGEKGHNITTCPRNYVTSTATTRATYRCGNCGAEGHNSRTCGRRETSSSSYYAAPSYSYSSPSPSYAYSSPAPSSGGGRSYRCGNCGGSGHNRRTCSG